MIKRLSLLLLAGCMSNQGLSTMSMAQENIWNLTRICLGMNYCEVGRIMHEPYRTQWINVGGVNYWVWFYVTRPAALDQRCLLKMNVTPLVFEEGVLIGWGFDVYDCMLKKRVRYAPGPSYGESFDEALERLETSLLTQNEPVEEHECPECRRPRKPLAEEDEEMLEEANDQNFNFW